MRREASGALELWSLAEAGDVYLRQISCPAKNSTCTASCRLGSAPPHQLCRGFGRCIAVLWGRSCLDASKKIGKVHGRFCQHVSLPTTKIQNSLACTRSSSSSFSSSSSSSTGTSTQLSCVFHTPHNTSCLILKPAPNRSGMSPLHTRTPSLLSRALQQPPQPAPASPQGAGVRLLL